MRSKILKPADMPELQPKVELDELYAHAPKMPFTATNIDDARAWQKVCRQALGEKVGFLDTPYVEPNPETIEEMDRGSFIMRKVVIWTAAKSRMPVYILIPKNVTGPLPVMIADHGHAYGVKDIVGLWENGEERSVPSGPHKDFAVALCKRGFIVFAPEESCFGERQTDYSYLDADLGSPPWPATCHQTAHYAVMLGKSALGIRVRDNMRLIDYISTVPEADVSHLGEMGISGGGLLTFFHTALDERVKACVVSGYYSTFKDSVLAMHHCACMFVPGLLELGEMYDLVGLILPRPMLVEGGTRDEIFPLDAVKRSVKRAREICGVLGGNPEKDVELDEFEGRHEISGRRAYDFLLERLL